MKTIALDVLGDSRMLLKKKSYIVAAAISGWEAGAPTPDGVEHIPGLCSAAALSLLD